MSGKGLAPRPKPVDIRRRWRKHGQIRLEARMRPSPSIYIANPAPVKWRGRLWFASDDIVRSKAVAADMGGCLYVMPGMRPNFIPIGPL